MAHISRKQKLEIRPFLRAVNRAVNGDRVVKGRFAMAYYTGGIPSLWGAIDHYTISSGSNIVNSFRLEMIVLMLEKVPSADLEIIKWMEERDVLFNGMIQQTTLAFHRWAGRGGHVWCPNCKLWTSLSSELDPLYGIVEHDGSQDVTYWWTTTCGHNACKPHYAGDEPQLMFIP